MTSLVEVYRRWPTNADCIAHLESVRWPGGPLCPYCGADRVSRNRDAKRTATAERWKCQRCLRSFSVTVGTIFHRTHVDLQRWFLLIALMLSARKGLSAMQAARDLDMRRPTVWSMMHRVRRAMKDDGRLLAGIVEMDESFVGGRRRKANRRDDDEPGPRGTSGKTPVVGAVERGGRVKAKAVKRGEISADDLRRFVAATIDCPRAVLTTDEYAGYNGLNAIVAHRRINHSVAYVERDLFSGQFGPVHTNTIEGVWAILKRAIFGQFHHVSPKYLPLYLNEIVYRYNARRHDDGFNVALYLAVNP
ncbi:IS1595 family transposase [Candidatus Uhrbacteria bacterium]|nr:IS1595 family transposase [Candidatus Uhrbacteria bacterium]